MKNNQLLAMTVLVLFVAVTMAGAQGDLGMEVLFERPDGGISLLNLTESQVAEDGGSGDAAFGSGGVLADAVVGQDGSGRPVFRDLEGGTERVASTDELANISELLGGMSEGGAADGVAAGIETAAVDGSSGNSAADGDLAYDGLNLAMADPGNPAGPGGKRAAGATVFHVKASAEGLIGARTAAGTRIKTYTEAVALPDRSALKRQTTVVYPATGRSISCPVLDVGPWNTNDPYWERPNGRPQAESGRDKFGRRTNRAGIDLFNGTWYKLLGLRTYNRRLIESTTGMVDWNFED